MAKKLVNGRLVDLTGAELAEFQARKPSGPKAKDVDAEALRRISALFGGKTGMELVWAEVNAVARGTELARKEAISTLTSEEEAERDQILVVWGRVKAVREAAKALKAGNIPADFTADSRWEA